MKLKNSEFAVRNATLADVDRVLEIYDYYVKNTAITFEYTTPSIEEFEKRMEKIMQRYPYFVVLKNGRIEGYAYANAFVARAAYDWSCELTIYIDNNVQKCGMGRLLYETLETELKKMGILNLYACISYPKGNDRYLTKNSADFHEHLGFRKVGEFHNCGYKFGHWYNMIWMEKIIGKHENEQLPITNYTTLKENYNFTSAE